MLFTRSKTEGIIKCNSALHYTHGVPCTRLVPPYRKGNTPRGCLMVTSLKRTATQDLSFVFFIIDPICNLESHPLSLFNFGLKFAEKIWKNNLNQWCRDTAGEATKNLFIIAGVLDTISEVSQIVLIQHWCCWHQQYLRHR
jgi:hypothetical protein